MLKKAVPFSMILSMILVTLERLGQLARNQYISNSFLFFVGGDGGSLTSPRNCGER